MAVDIAELIPSLQREVNPPGVDLYPAATNADWLGYLQDAFWEARLVGLLSGFTLDDSDILPVTSGSSDLGREYQQLIVLYAGYRIILTAFQNLNSGFRAKAGPVEFEQQKSAQIIKGLLDAIKEKIKWALDNLSDVGLGTGVAVFDAMIERSYSLATGSQWWVR